MAGADVIVLADVREKLLLARSYEVRAADESDADAAAMRNLAKAFRRRAFAEAGRHNGSGGLQPLATPNWWD